MYLYISNKFQEKQYIKENEFFDLFSKNISKKKKIYAKSETQELISLYLFNESMFQILNNKSIEDPSSIALFKNIVPECVRLNESLNLNGKEIYTFIELIKVEEILNSHNSDLFKLIFDDSNYELSKYLNIYLKNIKKKINLRYLQLIWIFW